MNSASTNSRRGAAFAVLLASFVACGMPTAVAQEFPAKPITLIVPYAAGSPTDTAVHAVAKSMQATLGQPVNIENKPGAGGADGIAAVARAAPDGYTLGVSGIRTTIIGAALDPKYPYHPLHDLAYAGVTGTTELVFVARPGLQANTMAELLAYARANPGKVRYGTTGTGNESQLAFELLKSMARIDLMRVTLNGDTAPLAEVVPGRTDIDLVPTIVALPEVKAGKIKALATAGPKRSKALPDLPTLAQSGVTGYAAGDWTVLVAPAATPPGTIAKLNAALRTALREPAVAAQFDELGMVASALSVGQTRDFVASETAKWTAVIGEVKLAATPATSKAGGRAATLPTARKPSTTGK